jgi:hypothetical protein
MKPQLCNPNLLFQLGHQLYVDTTQQCVVFDRYSSFILS